jgi:hypothetical protein
MGGLDLGGRVAGARRVAELPRGTVLETTPLHDLPFSYAGPVAASTSPRWYAPRALTIVNVFGSLGTDGAGTTTVNVKRNGTTVATLSFASGAHTASDTTITTPGMTADTDYLEVEVTAVGTGAEDLDVQVRYV